LILSHLNKRFTFLCGSNHIENTLSDKTNLFFSSKLEKNSPSIGVKPTNPKNQLFPRVRWEEKMFLNNSINAAATASSTGANLPAFSSPFFESPHLSLGSMTFEFPSRQLSPNLGSNRLGYAAILSTPQMSQQHQQFQQQYQQQQQQQQLQQKANNTTITDPNLSAEVTSANTTSTVGSGPIRLLQEPPPPPVFDSEKAKKAMFSVTSNLANLERFAQLEKNQGNNNNNSNANKNVGATNSQQQQPQTTFNALQPGQATPSLGQGTGSQLMGTSFFDSPLLAHTMIDYTPRQLSPPSTAAFLNSVLAPDTPGKNQASISDTGPAPLDPAQLRKSASVVSNLMNAELKSQSQKKKQEQVSGAKNGENPSSINAAPKLFPPLDQNSLRPSGQQGQVTSSNNMSSQQNNNANFGLNSNLIRAHRLSMGGFIGGNGVDDNKDLLGGFDMPFGGDFGYTFSPGEIARSLAPSIPESPLQQNLRMYSSYGSNYPSSGPTYSSLMPPAQSGSSQTWQPPAPQPYQPPHSQQHGRLPPLHPYGTMMNSSLYDPNSSSMTHSLQMGLGKGKGLPPKRPKKEDLDSSEQQAKKKARKPPKEEDPDEPKITSKHRGVCWYKRTKKWVVQTKVNGKRVHVGYFDDEEKAAEAYRNAVQGIQIKKALEAKQKTQMLQQQQQQMSSMADGSYQQQRFATNAIGRASE
jgi:hypothetical protein